MVSAIVSNIRQETPSTKSFDLTPITGEVHFLPGQWVDVLVQINGRTEIGGYSITSNPSQKRSISLAVKDLNNDFMTRYIHDSMVDGDMVFFNVGGTCTYSEEKNNALLLAGGIGITPLMSIFKNIGEDTDHKALLFHSASCSNEFLFEEEIKTLCLQHPNRLFYRQTLSRNSEQLRNQTFGRITKSKLQKLPVSCFDAVFLCGPDKFISDIYECLIEIGFDKNHIYYEKWW